MKSFREDGRKAVEKSRERIHSKMFQGKAKPARVVCRVVISETRQMELVYRGLHRLG